MQCRGDFDASLGKRRILCPIGKAILSHGLPLGFAESWIFDVQALSLPVGRVLHKK